MSCVASSAARVRKRSPLLISPGMLSATPVRANSGQEAPGPFHVRSIAVSKANHQVLLFGPRSDHEDHWGKQTSNGSNDSLKRSTRLARCAAVATAPGGGVPKFKNKYKAFNLISFRSRSESADLTKEY